TGDAAHYRAQLAGWKKLFHATYWHANTSSYTATQLEVQAISSIALGADAVSLGTAALIALGDNSPDYAEDYAALGSAPGFFDEWQGGRDPAGITTQDPDLTARLDPELGGKRVANYLRVLTLEAQTLARACGKSHVHNLEPEDLNALTVEAAAMARVPLAGTTWIPGGAL
ncbi:MAG: glutamate synthase-related protein, partial [Pseudomonadota bacterium]|nr:glutamate synthase-related protein [Pseudomonadota bacterium]